MKSNINLDLQLDPELIREHVSRWSRSEQAIFSAVFVSQKPRKDIAHDLGLPLPFLDEKIEELTRRLRTAPK